MATIEKSFDAGLHSEQLSGRTQEIFFSAEEDEHFVYPYNAFEVDYSCLLYTSPSPRDLSTSRMPSSA